MPKQSAILDELYAKHSPFRSQQADSAASQDTAEPQILLNDTLIEEVIKRFGLEEQARVDLRRAISQLEARLKGPKAAAGSS